MIVTGTGRGRGRRETRRDRRGESSRGGACIPICISNGPIVIRILRLHSNEMLYAHSRVMTRFHASRANGDVAAEKSACERA